MVTASAKKVANIVVSISLAIKKNGLLYPVNKVGSSGMSFQKCI
jgi:hypothetical protein